MSKVAFNAEIIGELRHRVIAHNEATHDPGFMVKLGQMKGLYKAHHGVNDTMVTTLTKVDRHLAGLRQADMDLAKARPPRRGRFDPSRHPRDASGEFEPGGQAHRFRDVGSREEHRRLADENAGYQAFQTQVIPETRYSQFGPKLAALAAIGAGAATGATATIRGTPVDRAVTAGLRAAGGAVASQVGGKTAKHAIRGARTATRAAIGGINRVYGTQIRRPGPQAGEAAIPRITEAARRAGRALGGGTGRALASTSIPAAIARRLAGGGGKGRVLGAAVGAVFPGALAMAPLAHHAMTTVGPYLDTLFPRRVRKQLDLQISALIDDPEVLAKQAELMGLDVEDELAKVSFAALGRIGRQVLRSRPPPLRPIFSRIRGAGRAAAVQGGEQFGPRAPTAAEEAPALAGHRVFLRGRLGRELGQAGALESVAELGAKPVGIAGFGLRSLRRIRQTQAARVIAHGGLGAIAGVAAGAAVGHLTGEILRRFDLLHPRDEKGRWTHRGSGAALGARIGAATGVGLGIAAGVLAARRGHAALLNQAFSLMGEQAGAMRATARQEAQNTHAARFAEKNQKLIWGPQKGHPGFAPGQIVDPLTVRNRLEQVAVDKWNAGIGAIIKRATPREWYHWQLNREFDRAVMRDLRSHGPIPLKDGHNAAQGAGNLLNNVDRDKLTGEQQKLWDDLVDRHAKKAAEIEAHFTARQQATSDIGARQAARRTELQQMDADKTAAVDRWQEMRGENPTLAQIRAFGQQNLGYTLPANIRNAQHAFEHMDRKVADFARQIDDEVEAANRKGGELDRLDQEFTLAQAREGAELAPEELGAITNPFAGARVKRGGGFLDPLPNAQHAEAAVRQEASREFMRESGQHAQAAEDHLNALMASHQALINAQMPNERGLARRAVDRVLPVFSAHLHQASEDIHAMAQGDRASMGPTMAKIYDVVMLHRDPKAAWAAIQNMSEKAKAKGEKAGKFALQHWKSLAGISTIASAMGVIDLEAGDRGGKRVKLQPSDWHLPQGMRPEMMWPNPITRPHEALVGVSFRDRDGQRKFLWGEHIFSKEGEHHTIPPGAEVQSTINQVRQGSGQKASEVKAADQAGLTASINDQKTKNNISEHGPEGFKFLMRTGDDRAANDQERKHANEFYDEVVKPFEGFPSDQTTRHADRYWGSLSKLFETDNPSIFRRHTKVSMLVGGQNRKRGIFAGKNHAFPADSSRADHAKVRTELERQITDHEPTNAHEYGLLRRALWLVGMHYGLSDQDQGRVVSALDSAYRRKTNQAPPISAESATAEEPSSSGGQTAAEIEAMRSWINDQVARNPASGRKDTYADDGNYRNILESAYERSFREATGTPQERHRRARQDVQRQINGMKKGEDTGELRKFGQRFTTTPQHPPGRMTPALPKPPSITGTYLRQEARPHQALSQVGSYGLGQAGNAAGEFLGHVLFPGSGILPGIARFGIGSAGNLGGGVGGQIAGRKLGRAIGDRTTNVPGETESLVRGTAGTGAQIVGTMAAKKLIASRLGFKPTVETAVQDVAGRAAPAIAGAAERAFGERVGGAVGGWLGRLGGAAAGTAVEPGGGTVAGAAGGWLAGQAIGAGIGYLADEGVGLLYHHLSRYGAHVPHMAAATLGVTPQQRQRAASMAGMA